MGSGTPREMEIVGIASPVKHFTLDEEPLVTLYIPLYQMKPNILSCELAVRTHGDPLRAADTIRSAVQKVDPEVPASVPRTLDQFWSAAIAGRKFNSTLLAIFAAAALLLAAAGLYALLSFTVAQRTREIGIRMAVGAGRASVLGLIVRDGMTLALTGIALGCAGSLLAARWIATLLFGVRSSDIATLAAAGVVLIVTAMLALILPAWRATRVDAMVALRTE
jgi:putative ABC transport system permease protein